MRMRLGFGWRSLEKKDALDGYLLFVNRRTPESSEMKYKITVVCILLGWQRFPQHRGPWEDHVSSVEARRLNPNPRYSVSAGTCERLN